MKIQQQRESKKLELPPPLPLQLIMDSLMGKVILGPGPQLPNLELSPLEEKRIKPIGGKVAIAGGTNKEAPKLQPLVRIL